MNLTDFCFIKHMAEKHSVENLRFIIPLSPLRGFLGMAYRSSNDSEFLFECSVDESRYRVKDGYKITLKATDPHYGSETFYQSDLESMIRSYHQGKTSRVYTMLCLSANE